MRGEHRSRDRGVIKRKIGADGCGSGGGGFCWSAWVLRNEMHHKSKTNADEVHHFTLIHHVQAQTISGCVIRADAARCLHHLFMAAILLRAHRNSCSLFPLQSQRPSSASLPPPTPLSPRTSLTPALSKLRLSPPQSIASSKSLKKNPLPPIFHVCMFERARQSSGRQFLQKLQTPDVEGVAYCPCLHR